MEEQETKHTEDVSAEFFGSMLSRHGLIKDEDIKPKEPEKPAESEKPKEETKTE